VLHAFDEPVTVRLGRVHEFANRERTFYVEVLDTTGLDRARERLYDGTHLQLDGWRSCTWHVTCLRDSRTSPDVPALRRAAEAFHVDLCWTIDTISYLELLGDRYVPLREWSVSPVSAA
jgi:2'-5' RNA ligase